ncbi:DUF1345 domain-containing protein [Flavobacterium sp. RHBU_3]|uniref:DUF1345 domain-containing protein n=1 Tax=Flavobacterium sp. RHBU_3 TaxID=3391184 RepID=UPI003984DCF0
MRKKSILSRWVAKTSGYHKILLSLLLSLCVTLALLPLHISSISRLIISWDIFAIGISSMMWLLFSTTTADEQKEIVQRQDDDIAVIFAIVLVSVCISFTGALLLTFNNNSSDFDKGLRTVATIAAITSSWVLLHTIFTVRYAHLYHDSSIVKTEDKTGGIDFPNPEPPDYIDFAYFSFVIGMTFQVSDVTISSKTIRRYALMHSLISFVFNTIIVALTVNILAGANK